MIIMTMRMWNFAVFLITVVVAQLCTISALPPTLVENVALNNVNGSSVDLSANGLMMIVGIAAVPPTAIVYQRSNVTSPWMQIGPVINVTEPFSVYIGVHNTAISLDGTVIAVSGARMVDVYKLNMSSINIWEQVGASLDSDLPHDKEFPEEVAIDLSADGTTIVIGRTGYNRADGGAVTVYKFSTISNQWESVGRPLKGQPREFVYKSYQVNYFGDEVAITSDGTTIAFTSYLYWNPDAFPGSYKDRVIVYTLNVSKSDWEQVGSDISPYQSFFDRSALSLSADGRTLILGATGDFFSNYEYAVRGVVHVYQYCNVSNVWEKKFEKYGEPKDRQGSQVDISSDGSVIIFGSKPRIENGQVRLYVYRLSMISGNYEQIAPDINVCPGRNSSDMSPCSYRGGALAVSGDGNTYVFGTWGDSIDSFNNPQVYFSVNSMATYILDDEYVIPPMKPCTIAPTTIPTEFPTTSPILPTITPTEFPTSSPILPPSSRNYFTVIDANSDRTLGLFKTLVPGRPNTIDYSVLNTSSVSIESIFTSPNGSAAVQSVRMTLDSPVRNVCRNKGPFTLFGDVRGNISGAPLPLGRRLVTATAYQGKNCTGQRVGTLSQSFRSKGCNKVQYTMYDANSDKIFARVYNYSGYSNIPYNVSIGATFECGFQPKSVVFNMWNFRTHLDPGPPTYVRKEKFAPYFLFGDDKKGNIFPGQIPTGGYMVNVAIDGIAHPTIQLYIFDTPSV